MHILETAPLKSYTYILHIVLVKHWIEMEKTYRKYINNYTSVSKLVEILEKLLHLNG